MSEEDPAAIVQVEEAPRPPPAQAEDDLAQMVRVARAMVASGYFAGTANVAQAVVKMLAGKELGIPPVASMQGIYVVQGKVTLSANVIAGLIKRSGKYSYRVTEHTDAKCVIEFSERNSAGQWERIGTSSFTMDDARRAGVLRANSPWQTHPRNMLFARALTNGARWHCPDVTNSPLYAPEELREPQDEESTLPQEEAQDASSDSE